MILALRWVNTQMAHYLLREVDNEWDAFAEIRRFLEVNQILSNQTSLRMVEEKECSEGIIPAHKEVEVNGACFRIYYGNAPENIGRSLPDLTEAGLHWEKNGTVLMGERGVCQWYMPLLRYYTDLQARQEATKECH